MIKSATVVSFFTLLSRILGFVRDVIIAHLFGTQMAAEAFVVAFRIPNTLRHLVGEGAVNAAVIPVLSEYLPEKEREEFWRVVNIVLNLLVLILITVAIAGIIFAPAIVRLIAFGFTEDIQKFELTVKLTRIMFSFIIFIGLAAYFMGILNALKHFAAPSVGPCFLNITMIVFGISLCAKFKEPILGMAVAVLIGGFLQLLVQIPALVGKGFKLHWPMQLFHPAARKIGKLLAPRILGSSIYQLNIFADTLFASLGKIVGGGAVAALYYANRLIQFPTAIFGIALATVCLPLMSQQAQGDNIAGLRKTLRGSLTLLFVVLIPSTVGLFFLAKPIIEVLFQRGEFNAASTQITALALMYYSLGIFAYSGSKMISTCFYALKDTITPVKVTFFSLLLNIILNFILMYPLKTGGIALATSISATCNFFILFFLLKNKIGGIDLRNLSALSLPVLACSVFMGLGCRWEYDFLSRTLPAWLALVLSVISGMIFFFFVVWRLGILKRIKDYGRA